MYSLLLVDDEVITLNSYYYMLTSSFGDQLNVEKCQFPSQVLQKITERIDILVADINMPKMTGYALNQLVYGKWNTCRTIFITGSNSVESAQKAIRDSKNIIDYVLKMEEEGVLLSAIRKAIYKLDMSFGYEAMLPGGSAGDGSGPRERPSPLFGPSYADGNAKSASVSTEIASALHYINNHLGEDLSLNRVSDIVYLSPSYFSKMFKQSVGIGFCEYVTERRISRAQTMIRTTSDKIGEIAKLMGFESVPYFNRIFKSFCGCTPHEYRKQNITLT